MLRIGLTQRVEIQRDSNERRNCLDQAWGSLLLANDMLPIPLPNQVDDLELLLRELRLDEVILTGGNDLGGISQGPGVAPERDLFEEKLLRACGEQDLPVLGVCRGLQKMVVHHGGTVRRIAHHVATTHPITLHAPEVMPLRAGMIVNSFHNFGVRQEDLGPHWQLIATAPDGSVEAIAHRTLRQWAVMWHLERPPSGEEASALLRSLSTAVRAE